MRSYHVCKMHAKCNYIFQNWKKRWISSFAFGSVNLFNKANRVLAKIVVRLLLGISYNIQDFHARSIGFYDLLLLLLLQILFR